MSIWTDAVRVIKLYPELRSILVHRVFWKPSHPPLIVALVGALMAARQRRYVPSLLLLSPYVAHYRRLHSSDGSWATLIRLVPVHLAVDLSELLTMVRGSLMHRTLML